MVHPQVDGKSNSMIIQTVDECLASQACHFNAGLTHICSCVNGCPRQSQYRVL